MSLFLKPRNSDLFGVVMKSIFLLVLLILAIDANKSPKKEKSAASPAPPPKTEKKSATTTSSVPVPDENGAGLDSRILITRIASLKLNLRQSTRLLIAFVLDRTSYHYFYEKFSGAVQSMYMYLHSQFPGTQVALTSFQDYENEDKPRDLLWVNQHGIVKRTYSKRDHCYALEAKFSSNIYSLDDAVQRMPTEPNVLGPEGKESSLQAVYFTATDSRLGWPTNGTSNGQDVQRFIVLVTDNDIVLPPDTLKTKSQRSRLMDRSHACLKGPTAFASEIDLNLHYQKIKLIVGLARTPIWSGVDLEQVYKNYLSNFTMTPYELFQFDLGNVITLVQQTVSKIVTLIDRDFQTSNKENV